MKGIVMRNRYARRRHAAAFAGILAVAITAGAGPASAEDDEDEAFDVKIFRRVMRDLGFKREEGIDYRERAPLVVPPSRDLPQPQAEAPSARVPAWPKDPDVVRRREASAAEKARIRGDNAHEAARALRPDELARDDRGQPIPKATAPQTPRPSGEEAGRPLPPSQLQGSGKNWWTDMFSAIGPERPESAPFSGEPPRTSMTSPPPGYQTPSSGQPYGVGLPRDTSKPETVESRMEPRR
jgi:hypothetical protein